jgi:hypothetical protein
MEADLLAHKYLSKLAGYSNAEAFSVMQSKRNLLRTGVYMGNCRFYHLADAARAILLRRLRDLDIRESIASTMIDSLPLGALEAATEAFESGQGTGLVVAFTRTDTGVTAAINAPHERAGTTLTFDLTEELLSALETQELNA